MYIYIFVYVCEYVYIYNSTVVKYQSSHIITYWSSSSSMQDSLSTTPKKGCQFRASPTLAMKYFRNASGPPKTVRIKPYSHKHWYHSVFTPVRLTSLVFDSPCLGDSIWGIYEGWILASADPIGWKPGLPASLGSAWPHCGKLDTSSRNWGEDDSFTVLYITLWYVYGTLWYIQPQIKSDSPFGGFLK